jgi:hypothetical protein
MTTATSQQKLHSEHTIADILRLKPQWFFDKQGSETSREAARDNLNYLHTLLEYGLGHMASMPFEAVFDGFLFCHSPEDRGEINKALMTYRVDTKRTKPVFNSVLAPVCTRFGMISQKDLRTALKPDIRMMNQRLNSIVAEISDNEYSVKDWEESINKYRDHIRDSIQTLRALEAAERAIRLEIEDGTKSVDISRLNLLKSVPKEWLVVHIEPQQFIVVRKLPIIMNYIGTAESGMAKSINMGYIALWYDFDLNCKGSATVADYIYAGSTSKIHPHISGSNICWGNKAHKAEALKQQRDYAGYWALLESVITTYCPDNPYVTFDKFENNQSSGYRWMNPEFFNTSGVRYKRGEILRMIAETASDSFLENYKGPDTAAIERYKENKQSRFSRWFNELHLRMRGEQAAINALITQHHVAHGEYASGEAFANILRAAGIKVPSKNILLENDLHWGDLSETSLYVMFVIYGRLPFRVKQANGTYKYHLAKAAYNQWKLINISGSSWRWEVWTSSTAKTTTSSVSSINEERMPEDAIAALPERFRPAVPDTAVAPPQQPPIYGQMMPPIAPVQEMPTHDEDFDIAYDVPEDEEESEDDEEHECEHDWSRSNGICRDCEERCVHEDAFGDHDFDRSGHCRTCGYYDQAYDEDYSEDD